MDYFYQQVLQKDVTRRLQVGQDLIDYLHDPHRSPDVEQDKPRLDKTIDELTGWVNSSNFKVRDPGQSSCVGTALPLQHPPLGPVVMLASLSRETSAKGWEKSSLAGYGVRYEFEPRGDMLSGLSSPRCCAEGAF